MNKTKIKPKLILGAVVVILIFSLLPGALAAKSTKLDFGGKAVETLMDPGDTWMEGVVMHMRFYKENDLFVTIDGFPYTGYSEENFHAKINTVTGNMVVNGKVKFYITLDDEQIGTFYGTIKAKIVAGIMDGKYTMQGAGDFDGWKLFGIVYVIDPIIKINGLEGIILIPN